MVQINEGEDLFTSCFLTRPDSVISMSLWQFDDHQNLCHTSHSSTVWAPDIDLHTLHLCVWRANEMLMLWKCLSESKRWSDIGFNGKVNSPALVGVQPVGDIHAAAVREERGVSWPFGLSIYLQLPRSEVGAYEEHLKAASVFSCTPSVSAVSLSAIILPIQLPAL